jgi:hypothetical protein
MTMIETIEISTMIKAYSTMSWPRLACSAKS